MKEPVKKKLPAEMASAKQEKPMIALYAQKEKFAHFDLASEARVHKTVLLLFLRALLAVTRPQECVLIQANNPVEPENTLIVLPPLAIHWYGKFLL